MPLYWGSIQFCDLQKKLVVFWLAGQNIHFLFTEKMAWPPSFPLVGTKSQIFPQIPLGSSPNLKISRNLCCIAAFVSCDLVDKESVNKTKCQLHKRLAWPIILHSWSGKGYHLWMWLLWGSNNNCLFIRPFSACWHPKKQPGDPRVSLAVFCNNLFDSRSSFRCESRDYRGSARGRAGQSRRKLEQEQPCLVPAGGGEPCLVRGAGRGQRGPGRPRRVVHRDRGDFRPRDNFPSKVSSTAASKTKHIAQVLSVNIFMWRS